MQMGICAGLIHPESAGSTPACWVSSPMAEAAASNPAQSRFESGETHSARCRFTAPPTSPGRATTQQDAVSADGASHPARGTPHRRTACDTTSDASSASATPTGGNAAPTPQPGNAPAAGRPSAAGRRPHRPAVRGPGQLLPGDRTRRPTRGRQGMGILCRTGRHTWDWDHETIHLRGTLKVTTVHCQHCGARRGDTVRL